MNLWANCPVGMDMKAGKSINRESSRIEAGSGIELYLAFFNDDFTSVLDIVTFGPYQYQDNGKKKEFSHGSIKFGCEINTGNPVLLLGT